MKKRLHSYETQHVEMYFFKKQEAWKHNYYLNYKNKYSEWSFYMVNYPLFKAHLTFIQINVNVANDNILSQNGLKNNVIRT